MKRWLLIIFLLAALFANPAPVKACSCMMPGSPASEFSQANVVFSGQVTGMTDKQNMLTPWLIQLQHWLGFSPSYTDYGYLVTLLVNASWKGVTNTTAQVSTGYGGGDCGYGFSLGMNYLVYAYGPTQDLQAGICSRTAEISQAAADLNYLNTLPALPLTVTPAGSFGWLGAAVFVIILLCTALMFFLLWLQRRRRNSPSQLG